MKIFSWKLVFLKVGDTADTNLYFIAKGEIKLMINSKNHSKNLLTILKVKFKKNNFVKNLLTKNYFCYYFSQRKENVLINFVFFPMSLNHIQLWVLVSVWYTFIFMIYIN